MAMSTMPMSSPMPSAILIIEPGPVRSLLGEGSDLSMSNRW